MQRDGAKGWITVSTEGRDVVRMIRPTRGGPEALYDVTFTLGAEPAFSTPENRTLNAEEVAQYSARMLALDNIGQRCAETYNTVALKDPESDGWLVWALGASTNDDVIHHARTLPVHDFSGWQDHSPKGCAVGWLSAAQQARDAAATPATATLLPVLSINHVVSLKPVETYVFTSMSYPYTMFVGTNDGEVWKFEKGTVTAVPDDAPDPDGYSARVHAGLGEGCLATVTNPKQMPPAFFNTKGFFKVIEPTERNATFELKLKSGFEAVNITCGRRTIVPSEE